MPRTITVPEGLQTIIDTHRALFGGFVMQDGDTEASAEKAPTGDGQSGEFGTTGGQSKDGQSGKGTTADKASEDDKPLGPAGERALASVRDENKQLRADLAAFKKSLGDAFGIDPGDKKTDPLAVVQQEVAALRRENQVQRVARTHGITDDADIALLMKAGDGDYVAELAARLKPATATSATDAGSGPSVTAQEPPVVGRVAPHLGKTNNGNRAGSVSQAAEDYLSRSSKKK